VGLETISFKLVVTGPFGAGKTTLIQAISETPVVATEVPSTTSATPAPAGKGTTTVSMDFGTRLVGGGPGEPTVELLLFGTPGQERFSFMWEILGRGMDGLLLLVDVSEPSTWTEAAAMVRAVPRRRGAPLVVGANRARPGQQVGSLTSELSLPAHVPVVACNVVDPKSSRDLVLVLLEEILAHGG
jgi:signal recognition particle receptor subunit beta